MEILDKIYGNSYISEPILIELIQSLPVQRLKYISQQGLPQEYYHRPVFSRFEHSLGVLSLLRKMGANLEEQVAGILHDVSHTCFSHVIDWVLGDPTKEDYQDKSHEKTLEKENISSILIKHNFDWKRIHRLENFGLLEREIPELCADRVDYTLREFPDKKASREIVTGLGNYDGKMAFSSIESAERFAKGYVLCQEEHWAGNEARARYFLLAKAIKKSLEKKYVDKKDFLKTDSEVMDLMLTSGDKEVLNILFILKQPLEIYEVRDESVEGIVIPKKIRYVDPAIYRKGTIQTLSEISSGYAQILKEQKINSEKKIKIRGFN